MSYDDVKVLDAMVNAGATMTLLSNEEQAETLRFPGGGHSTYGRLKRTRNVPERERRIAVAMLPSKRSCTSRNWWVYLLHALYIWETPTSSLGVAMNAARGGYFADIPSKYRVAIYTYYDPMGYRCQATEYFYWALTTILGHTEGWCNRHQDEWKPCTAADVSQAWIPKDLIS